MKITREDDRGGAVLNWAVRYSLGRYTYAPDLTISVIRPMLPDCSTKTVAVFVQDVSEWLERTEPGKGFHDNHWAGWKAFLDDCEAELERREDWPWRD